MSVFRHLKVIMSAGDEFYMREWPELVGRTYLEVLTMFEDAVPLGIRTPEGNHLLNPEDTFTIHEGKPNNPEKFLVTPACCNRSMYIPALMCKQSLSVTSYNI